MGKITGKEKTNELPEKVKLLYGAVLLLFEEGAEISDITVSDITRRAGIGKGTAYDYFDSKEDLIACSIIYQMQQIIEKVTVRMEGVESFRERVDNMLDWVEGGFQERACFNRFMHLLTDQSCLGQRIRQKIEVKSMEECLPMVFFYRLAQDGISRGEIRKDLPLDYVACALYSRMVSYMTFLYMNSLRVKEAASIRPHILRGILDEFCI